LEDAERNRVGKESVQRQPQQEGGSEMLSQAMVRYGWYFPTVDHICRELGRQRTLKEATVNAISKDLIEDTLVVGRIKSKMAV